MIFYPKAFKERVKKAYPNNSAIQRALDTGDESLLNLLITENHKLPSIAEINSYSIKELEEKRKNMEKREEIFTEFMEIYSNHLMQKAKNG